VVLDQIQRSKPDVTLLVDRWYASLGKGATQALLRARLWSIWMDRHVQCDQELKAGGADDVCERCLVSTSADLYSRNAGPPGNAQYSTQTPLVKPIQIPRELSTAGPFSAP